MVDMFYEAVVNVSKMCSNIFSLPFTLENDMKCFMEGDWVTIAGSLSIMRTSKSS